MLIIQESKVHSSLLFFLLGVFQSIVGIGLSLLRLQSSRLYSLNAIFFFHSWSPTLAWINAGGTILPKVSFLRLTAVCCQLLLVHFADTAWLISSSSECLSSFVVPCFYWCSCSFFARISFWLQIANNTRSLVCTALFAESSAAGNMRLICEDLSSWFLFASLIWLAFSMSNMVLQREMSCSRMLALVFPVNLLRR